MKKRAHKIVFAIIAVLFMVFSIYNLLNNDDFLEAPLSTIISIVFVIYISYFLTQRQSDKREQKKILLGLLEEIQKFLSDESAYIINSTETTASINIRKRSVSNKIQILHKQADSFDIKNETTFIVERFQEYEDFLGNHIDDLQHLQKSHHELRRPLELIYSKIIEIMLKLYE